MTKICATCEHFAMNDSPRKSEGIGMCNAYDDPVEPFVRWDHRYCILYGRAKDWQRREQWIAMRKREDVSNVAAA